MTGPSHGLPIRLVAWVGVLLALAGIIVVTLIDLHTMRELNAQRQTLRDGRLQTFAAELQRPIDAFQTAIDLLPPPANSGRSTIDSMRGPALRDVVRRMGMALHNTWGLRSVQLFSASQPRPPLAAWSDRPFPAATASREAGLSSGSAASTGIRCAPDCVQSIVVGHGERMAVFERVLDDSLQRFHRQTGSDIAIVHADAGANGVAAWNGPLAAATRAHLVTDALGGVAAATAVSGSEAVMRVDSDGRHYEVAQVALTSAAPRLRVFLIDDITELMASLDAARTRNLMIAASLVMAGSMLLLAMAWAPLQRWRAIASSLPLLAQLPVARLRERFPKCSRSTCCGNQASNVTHAITAVADRIQSADQTLQLTRRALKQTRRNLEFVQTMARVVSWSGEPLSGAFAFGQGASEISSALAHVCNWSEFLAFVHPEDRLKLLRAWRAGEPGGRLDIAFRLEIDQDCIDLHAVAQFEAVGRARTLRAFGMMQDVTETRSVQRLLAEHADRLEEQVIARTRELSAERDRAHARADARGRFAASMSHEIRTPMNAVLGLAQIGAREGGDAVTVARFEEILAAGDHLVQVINDVLDLSKLEAGRVNIESQVFDIGPVVTQAVGMVRPQADVKGLALRLRLTEGVSRPVRGDALRLRQILINLLANAVSHTKAGSVSVEVTRDGDYSRFSVRDTGKGMNRTDLQRLFSPFYQVPTEQDSQRNGTGLGLAISNELAKAMGGDIQVDSRPGAGSEFVLRLPLAEADVDASGPIQRQSTIVAARPLSGLRVLVVDDVAINRKVTAHLLRMDGAAVEAVGEGAAAVARVLDDRVQAIDIVLMDVQMPGIDGRAATRRIRESGCRVPVIGYTADSSNAGFEASLQAGMQDQLIKPLMREMLVERVLVQARRTAVDEESESDGLHDSWAASVAAQNTL